LAIDVGAAAIGRTYTNTISTNTYVDATGPASGSGTITAGGIWLAASSSSDIWIGTFSNVGNDLTCRDSESIGDIASGSEIPFAGVDIIVVANDHIGAYCKSGTATIERDISIGDGNWYKAGNCIDADYTGSFSFASGRVQSLHGTGTEGGAAGQPTMRRWGGVPGMVYTGRRSW